MVYSTAGTKGPAKHIRQVIDYGTKLILAVVGVGLFRTEFLRIMSLPRELNNDLYLVLLGAATLLTAGWVFVANKELEVMCDFLDPAESPDHNQIVIGMAIASALTILLYTARNPVWFGLSYSVYMLLSVLGWTRVKREMKKAIRGSRDNLEGEPKQIRDIYGSALDILDRYYVQQWNLPRVWTSFALGVLGLIFSISALRLGRTIFDTVAYLIFILSILGLELGLAFTWRFILYARVRHLEVAKYNLVQAKHHKRRRQTQ